MHDAGKTRFALARAALASLFAFAALLGECQAVTLHMLPVGDVGNAIDPRPGAQLGAVDYTFWLDKYDVTNTQYVEFLNAKASAADPYGLYDTHMTTFQYGGITRSATAPYTYSAKNGMSNKPVVYVSWYDALRFTNWLTNGQGNGDTETGSYLITNGGVDAGFVTVPTVEQRAAWSTTSRHYLLPSTNEWYKAAFYKGGGTNAGYWSYPFATNTPPTPGPPGTFHGANYLNASGGFAIPDAFRLTDVGAYNFPGPYGQMDMGGNAKQFTDSPYEFDNTLIENRGGAWSTGVGTFQGRDGSSPSLATPDISFRIMMVPEPASVRLAAVAVAGLLLARCRRRRQAS